jgi:rare lipoprotein A (peptidoglycan hydrolase)
VVEVNDYGPELWTGRIIDLDVLAFDAISNRRKGLTDVTVVPYLPEEDEHESGLPSLFQN